MNHQNDQNKESRKYLIPVDGKYYETTKEIYEVYYQMDRRERYLEERDIKKGVKSFSDISSAACFSPRDLTLPCSLALSMPR
ncbi:hypothetical protein KHM83_18810 [Fusibacter paucivorans]|uniref:Uncharacterized protein n=1 Tax=Fusibacter paucivorans TaxID=76009 RepID=A0ABS5PUF9_9FIRM|nr:hypothetical protein [Fusibacter paucivorans]MBS7528723.1 hypothetical protein [Fusibacter paucivorans]